MSLSKIFTVLIAVSSLLAFDSMGDAYTEVIVGQTGLQLEIGSVVAAAEGPAGTDGPLGIDGNPATVEVGAAGAAGLDGSGPEGANGAAGQAGGLQPGAQVQYDDRASMSGVGDLMSEAGDFMSGFDAKSFFTWDNLSGVVALAAGAAASGLIGFGLGKLGASLAAITGSTVMRTFGIKLALLLPRLAIFLGGTAFWVVAGGLAVAAVVYFGYKGIKHLMEKNEGLPGAGANDSAVGSNGLAAEGPSELPTADDLADQLDEDGNGISEEDLLDNDPLETPSVDVPDLDPVIPGDDLSGVDDLLNGGADGVAEEPEAPAANTPAKKFAEALMNGSEKDARDKFQALLTSVDSLSHDDPESKKKIEKQAREILDYLAHPANDYKRNEKILQWTEEAIMLGYDPRLPLALVDISLNGGYPSNIYNDFGGAWMAVGNTDFLYDTIDALGQCGTASRCTDAMQASVYNSVSGRGQRLAVNRSANASEMSLELADAIELYLPGEQAAADRIRELSEAYSAR